MTSASPTSSITLRADRQGYVLDDLSVDGFADDPALGADARVKLARWAQRFAEPDAQQLELLQGAQTRPQRASDALLAALRDAEEDIPRAYAEGFYEGLSDEQLESLRDPAAVLQGRSYPLTMGDLEKLTGATQRQLRYWESNDLLPSHRIGNQRRFLGAGAARAMYLAQAPQHEIATYISVAQGGEDAGRILRLIGGVLGTLTERVADSAKQEVSALAEAMMAHARPAADAIAGRDTSKATRAHEPKPSSPPAKRKVAARKSQAKTLWVIFDREKEDWVTAGDRRARTVIARHQHKRDAVTSARQNFAASGVAGQLAVQDRRSGRIVKHRVGPAASASSRASGSSARSSASRSGGSSARSSASRSAGSSARSGGSGAKRTSARSSARGSKV